MKTAKNEVGSLNVLLIPLILSVVLFFAAAGFGVWAYLGMQDYRDNVDQKVESAVTVAIDKNSTKKDNEFLEKEKAPNRTYKGSAILGSITFDYPKTWSGYYKETDKDLQLIMQKDLVNGDQKSLYPLKVEVLNSTYDVNIKSFEGNVKSGKLKASAYRLTKLPDILGTRFDGEFPTTNRGSVILLPQREKTIKISTEYDENIGDLNNIILPSFTFTP
jgi:hypothetical protein